MCVKNPNASPINLSHWNCYRTPISLLYHVLTPASLTPIMQTDSHTSIMLCTLVNVHFNCPIILAYFFNLLFWDSIPSTTTSLLHSLSLFAKGRSQPVSDAIEDAVNNYVSLMWISLGTILIELLLLETYTNSKYLIFLNCPPQGIHFSVCAGNKGEDACTYFPAHMDIVYVTYTHIVHTLLVIQPAWHNTQHDAISTGYFGLRGPLSAVNEKWETRSEIYSD